jgi:type IV pilus assembly protein PilC
MPATTCFRSSARSGFAGLKRRKVKLEPFLIFNQQFLTLIRAGLPILGSLQMLAKIQKNAHFAAQLDDVSTRVKTGEALSSAFEAQSGFPVMYTTTLLAGERSGNLLEVLERYVSFQRITLTFRKKLITSLIYPCVLMTLVTALVIFMFAYVVPQFATLYDQLGSKLPAMTMACSTSQVAQHNLLWILLVIAVGGRSGYRFSITERGPDFVDGVRIRLPVFGNIWLKYQVALFARTLSRCSPAACRWCRRLKRRPAPSPRAASRKPWSSITTVREGKSLAEALVSTKVFSRPGRGDDHRRRADRRAAADAQLRGRIF